MTEILNHSKTDTLMPVEGWEEKVKKLNEWISANYEKVTREGLSKHLLHTVYIQFHNRLKYTAWEIRDGKYNNLFFRACSLTRLKYYKKEGRYVSLAFDVTQQTEQESAVEPQLNQSKINRCVKQLSEPQQIAYKQMFVYRRSVREAADELGLSYSDANNFRFRAIRRIAQLYNKP